MVCRIVVLSLLALFASDRFAFAQEDNAPINVSIANPGARSLSLGGAFVGLADDATAALTNPAGLVTLRAPEVSVEFRARREDIPQRFSRRFPNITDSFSVESKGPSYLSFVYPGSRWAIAGYRQEFGRSRFALRTALDNSSADIRIDTYGAAVGFRLASRVRVGGSVAVNFGEAALERLAFGTLVSGRQKSTDYTGSAGVLLGLVERPGAAISLVQVGGHYRATTTRLDDFIDLRGGNVTSLQRSPLLIPELFSVGGAVRLGSSFTATTEFQRITRRLETGFGRPRVSTIPRVGFEYVMPVSRSPAFRAGYWHDPYFSYVISREDLFRDDLISQDHVTGGFGLSFSRWIEANVGVDISRDTRSVIASAIVRMPR